MLLLDLGHCSCRDPESDRNRAEAFDPVDRAPDDVVSEESRNTRSTLFERREVGSYSFWKFLETYVGQNKIA